MPGYVLLSKNYLFIESYGAGVMIILFIFISNKIYNNYNWITILHIHIDLLNNDWKLSQMFDDSKINE